MPVQKDLINKKIKPKEGYIIDFISGFEVKAKPEELDAVQPFTKILVNDLKYSKKQIQTRPQFKINFGANKFGFVDIAIFQDDKKLPNNLYIIVECKSKTRKDGIEQLKSYLGVSEAVIGVWFNGNEHVYLWKKVTGDFKNYYEELPSLPRKGQRVEDIGKYKKKDLIKPKNLTLLFKDIRNHLAGSLTGITRDETIAQQIINLLFCKIFDEMDKKPDDDLEFKAGVNESVENIKQNIKNLFGKVKKQNLTIFNKDDQIELDGNTLKYIIGQLQDYSLIDAERDAIRKAFEVFIGTALRGSEGQFFTPRNVIRTCVEIIDPKLEDNIIDPACGSGGFLVIALIYIWDKLIKEARDKKWSEDVFHKKKNELASKCFKGIDKDRFLSKVTKAYMALIGNGKENIFCENTLNDPKNWSYATQVSINIGSFNALFTNPPFGSKIKVKGGKILEQYNLGYSWKIKEGRLIKSNKLKDGQAPQILFIERCLQLLKEGGKMAIVLPEGILGNPTQEYIRKFILDNSTVLAVIDAPKETFLPSTSTKTCILFLEKGKSLVNDYKIFMAIAYKCGHDSRDNKIYKIDKTGEFIYDEEGNKVIDDDFPVISKRYSELQNKLISNYEREGFYVSLSELISHSLIPRIYDPTIKSGLSKLKEKYSLISIGDLIEEEVLSIQRGQGVKKKYYGTGDIPYIRTSDISNWELKIDPSYNISNEIYEKFKQDLKVNDILFVQDGGRLIGNSCVLLEKTDTICLVQSHFQIFRCEEKAKLNPFLLLYLLNTPIVKRQIESKIVRQSTLATIGERTKQLILPIPKDNEIKKEIIEKTKKVLQERAILRKQIEILSTTPLSL